MPGLHVENKTIGEIPVGSMIIIEDGKSRPFDALTDSLDDVIGVVYSVGNNSGRAFSLCDGPDYYLLDYYKFDERLIYELDEFNNFIENPNFESFNPFAQADEYSTIVYSGFCAVLNTYASLPSRWKVLKVLNDYKWILIR